MTPSPEDVERMIERLREQAEVSARYSSAIVDARSCLYWQAADMLAALSAIGGDT